MIELNKIYNEDCLGENGMCKIPDRTVDLVLCDLPFGSTRLKWDVVLPFDRLWKEYERIGTDKCTYILFGNQPFTSMLIMSNLNLYKYNLVWDKKIISDPQFAKKKPLKQHEDICVFSKTSIDKYTYNPQKTDLHIEREWKQYSIGDMMTLGNGTIQAGKTGKTKGKYPKSILQFSNANQKDKIHPTQKPVNLCEWLIRAFSNEGDTVLDNCIGSGTTAIACINTNRNYIGFENDKTIFEKCIDRIKNIK